MAFSVKVVLFDDNKTVRDALGILFSTSNKFEWVGSYPDALGSVNIVEVYKPDVVLMDIDMPGISGIEATKIIKKKYPDQVILMLTTFDDDEKIFDAICAGASGYLVKSKTLSYLLNAVKEAHAGGAPMSPSIARRVLRLFQEKNSPADADAFHLTGREKEVLKYLVKGNSYKMIAGLMKLSYDTVHSHIRNIYKKLHVNSMSEAVGKALREKL